MPKPLNRTQPTSSMRRDLDEYRARKERERRELDQLKESFPFAAAADALAPVLVPEPASTEHVTTAPPPHVTTPVPASEPASSHTAAEPATPPAPETQRSRVPEPRPRVPRGRAREPLDPPAGRPDNRTGEPATLAKQVVLTPSAEKTFDAYCAAVRGSTTLALKHSELYRAIAHALEHARPAFEREARKLGLLRRAKNDRGNEAERDALERTIAQAIVAALRSTAAMD